MSNRKIPITVILLVLTNKIYFLDIDFRYNVLMYIIYKEMKLTCCQTFSWTSLNMPARIEERERDKERRREIEKEKEDE